MKNRVIIFSMVFFAPIAGIAFANDIWGIPDVSIKKNPAQTQIQIKNEPTVFDPIPSTGDMNMNIKLKDDTPGNSEGKGKSKGKGKGNQYKFFWD